MLNPGLNLRSRPILFGNFKKVNRATIHISAPGFERSQNLQPGYLMLPLAVCRGNRNDYHLQTIGINLRLQVALSRPK